MNCLVDINSQDVKNPLDSPAVLNDGEMAGLEYSFSKSQEIKNPLNCHSVLNGVEIQEYSFSYEKMIAKAVKTLRILDSRTLCDSRTLYDSGTDDKRKQVHIYVPGGL